MVGGRWGRGRGEKGGEGRGRGRGRGVIDLYDRWMDGWMGWMDGLYVRT